VVERGLEQRVTAPQSLLRRHLPRPEDSGRRRRPEEIVRSASGHMPECQASIPPGGGVVPHPGSDLVRDGDGQFLRPEDQPAVPIRRLLRAREPQILKRTLPQSSRPPGCGRWRTTPAACSRC